MVVVLLVVASVDPVQNVKPTIGSEEKDVMAVQACICQYTLSLYRAAFVDDVVYCVRALSLSSLSSVANSPPVLSPLVVSRTSAAPQNILIMR